jgi:Tol biopolymer transport system component/DNA-binding winged helix-turn-helix (wHTH) protein
MKDLRNRSWRFDNIEIDIQNLQVTVGGETRPLEPKSFRLLLFLLENSGRVLPKEEILNAVWGETFVSENSLARAITQIRKVLGDDPKIPRYIETVPTIGYRFIGEATLETAPIEPALAEAPTRVAELPPAPATPPRKPRISKPTLAAALVILAMAAAWWLRHSASSPSPDLRTARFLQITDQPGQELDPSLAPDGKSLVYSGHAAGNWDIYSQRIGGKNPVNLTKDSPSDDTEPVFSPDGERIAFRSERDGGGIFVMGATGENVKRVSDNGYNPAWSPDGSEIVLAATIAAPGTRLSSQSQLFAVNVTTGEKRTITPPQGIAMQPAWSPHGDRIAYWAQVEGRFDIWTVPARGQIGVNDVVRVTDDPPMDWNPVWSPDGQYLYFSSDRSGAMNLWRMPIDERTGKSRGNPEPVTTSSPYAGNMSFSRTGRRLAYVQRTHTSNIWRVAFDAARETAVGEPQALTQGTLNAGQAQASPDGQWVVFLDVRKQNDLYLMRADGSGLRQLTDDVDYHRWPAWSPDGKLIATYSNRGGKFNIWTIRPDGGGFRQITQVEGGPITHPVWAPDGNRLVYSVLNGTAVIFDPNQPWTGQKPEHLPRLEIPDTWFEAANWSPDGRSIAGWELRGDGKFTGISVYSFETGRYTHLTDFGHEPTWLKDSRRLLFNNAPATDATVYLLDTASRKFHPVFSLPQNQIQVAEISPDNRWIYYNLNVDEADIWLASLD